MGFGALHPTLTAKRIGHELADTEQQAEQPARYLTLNSQHAFADGRQPESKGLPRLVMRRGS
jgi:hypothetical protein